MEGLTETVMMNLRVTQSSGASSGGAMSRGVSGGAVASGASVTASIGGPPGAAAAGGELLRKN